MPGMSAAPTTTDAEHEREVATQADIEAAIATDAPVVETTEGDAPEEVAKVTLRSKNVDTYPVSVSVVGSEDELVFTDPDSTVEVDPSVAEQVVYSPVVEVAT